MPSALTTLREQFVTALQAGPRGLPPEHEFAGSSLRFRNPDGSWGTFANLQGASGPAGAAINFRDKAQLQAATVGAAVEFVTLSCYATPGIGAALYRKSASMPADPRRIQSADGFWFRAYPDNVFDMTTLGAGQGNGTLDDTALSDIITYINSLGASGTSSRAVIYWPNGQYNHTDCPVVLNRSEVAFIGQSKNGTKINYSGPNAWLRLGDRTFTQCARTLIRDFTITFSTLSPTTAFAQMENCFDTHIEQLNFQGFNRILVVGAVGVSASGCYSTSIRHCSGYSANTGQAAFVLNFGAGLYVSDIEWFVSGVTSPVHPASQTTVQGTAIVQQLNSNWDTVQFDNCFFQYFDIAFSLSGGVCINYIISNSFLANCKRYAVLLDTSSGGNIGGVRVDNSWLETWETDCVLIQNTGGFNENHLFIGNHFVNAGQCNLRIQGPTGDNITISGNRFGTANRLGTATGAIQFQSGQGVSIVNNTGNNDDVGSTGNPWRAPYGISIGSGCTRYIVSGNRMIGSTGSINVAADSVADKQRRVHNNAHADAALDGGYAKVVAGSLTGNIYTNVTPFVQEVSIYGGTVTGITLNGTAITGATSGTFTLQPGWALAVSNSVLPSVTVNVLA